MNQEQSAVQAAVLLPMLHCAFDKMCTKHYNTSCICYNLLRNLLCASEPGTLIVLKSPYPWRVEEPSIYESVRVHTAVQTGRTENDLVPNAPSVRHFQLACDETADGETRQNSQDHKKPQFCILATLFSKPRPRAGTVMVQSSAPPLAWTASLLLHII